MHKWLTKEKKSNEKEKRKENKKKEEKLNILSYASSYS